MSLYIWIGSFFAMLALDIAWALYTVEVADKRALQASVQAVALHALSSATTLALVADPRYLTATLLGAFAGTYIGVRWAARKEKP